MCCRTADLQSNTVIQGETTEDYFRMNIAIPFIDHLQQELITHFDAENRISKDIFIPVPTAIIKETNLNDLACRLQFWELDMPLPSPLLSKLKLWKMFWEQSGKSMLSHRS